MTNELSQSALTGTFIQCNACGRIDAEESELDSAVIVFFDDGWRDFEGVVYCPRCVDHFKTGKNEQRKPGNAVNGCC